MKKELPKTVAVMTMGCRLNQSDSALIHDRFQKDGYEVVKTNSEKEIGYVIVNSCTVTNSAAQKSRASLRKFKREHPDSCVIITGCSAEMNDEFWAEEVAADIVVPNLGKVEIMDYINAYNEGTELPASRSSEINKDFFDPEIEDSSSFVFKEEAQEIYPFISRSYLKVQEGCNDFCTFCIIPFTRGRERSRDWDEVIETFTKMVEAGAKEIVVTGVNVSTYNHDGRRLPELLEALASVEGDFRIRLSSTEPNLGNINLLDVMLKYPEKICRFLHLSIQHSTDEILTAMNRNYTIEQFCYFASEAKRRVPGLHLGTDFIVGFPGETAELFEDACDVVDKIAFSNMHIFPYSPREGTPAADMKNKVPERIAKERHKELSVIANKHSVEFSNSAVGQKLRVLIENEPKEGVFEGWSDNYLRVVIEDASLEKNMFADVTITEVRNDGKLTGKLI